MISKRSLDRRSKSLCIPPGLSLLPLSHETVGLKSKFAKLNEQDEETKEEAADERNHNKSPSLPPIRTKNNASSLLDTTTTTNRSMNRKSRGSNGDLLLGGGSTSLNYHRKSSIKLAKYISQRCDLTRLNKIPLRRRFSLNVPLESEIERNNISFPEIGLKRKKSLDSKISETVNKHNTRFLGDSFMKIFRK